MTLRLNRDRVLLFARAMKADKVPRMHGGEQSQLPKLKSLAVGAMCTSSEAKVIENIFPRLPMFSKSCVDSAVRDLKPLVQYRTSHTGSEKDMYHYEHRLASHRWSGLESHLAFRANMYP